MTDYISEIETRLARVRVHNGRGNLRESNRILCEIIEIMLAKMPPAGHVPAQEADFDEILNNHDYFVPTLHMSSDFNAGTTTVIGGAHMNVDSAVLHPIEVTLHPIAGLQIVTPDADEAVAESAETAIEPAAEPEAEPAAEAAPETPSEPATEAVEDGVDADVPADAEAATDAPDAPQEGDAAPKAKPTAKRKK